MRTAVFTANPDLVMAATSGNKEERESARNSLKHKYLEQFQAVAHAGTEYFGEFYKITKIANKVLNAA